MTREQKLQKTVKLLKQEQADWYRGAEEYDYYNLAIECVQKELRLYHYHDVDEFYKD